MCNVQEKKGDLIFFIFYQGLEITSFTHIWLKTCFALFDLFLSLIAIK